MENTQIQVFKDIYHSPPEVMTSAPGRINIIGEHTDYNQGYVLPAAIHLRNYFLASKHDGDEVSIFTQNLREKDAFSIKKIFFSQDKNWVNYIKGVFWVLKKQGFRLQGIQGLVFSDIPLEAGLSSSAALEVSVIMGLKALFGLNLSQEKIAKLAQKAENDFVGVKCGLMDQYISLFGEENKALFLDCETLRFKLIPLRLEKKGLSLLVCDSGVKRELASSAYNTRRKEAAIALESLKKLGIKNYKEVTSEMLEEQRTNMDEILYKRAKHIITENERVKRAVEALKKDDFSVLGNLLLQSHQSLRDDYQVSCPELDLLYQVGKKFPGCLGVRLIGAGFGGSVLVLLEKEKVEYFQNEVLDEGKKRGFPQPDFYKVEIGGGARVYSLEP